MLDLVIPRLNAIALNTLSVSLYGAVESHVVYVWCCGGAVLMRWQRM